MGARSKFLLLLTILSALASCSGYQAGQIYRVDSERVIAKSFDSVWSSVEEFCRANNFQITESDSTTGFLSFYGNAERPDLDSACDCGHISSIDGQIQSRNFKCNVILRRASWDSTLVTIKPTETASIHLNEGDRLTSAECSSTGAFEHRLFDVLNGTSTAFSAQRIDSIGEPVDLDTSFSGWRFWLGAAIMPFTVRNIHDVHLSDWQRHSNDTQEGRLALPLTELKTSGNHGGGLIAAGYDAKAWTPFAELQVDFGSTDRALLLSLGSLFRFAESSSLTFNLVPKIGWFYLYGDMELGSVGGKYSSVELTDFTLMSGDTITAKADGFLMQFGVDAEYALSTRSSLYISGSFSKTAFGNMRLASGDNSLNLASAAIVEPTISKGFGSTQHASVSPQLASTGLAVQLGFRIRLH